VNSHKGAICLTSCGASGQYGAICHGVMDIYWSFFTCIIRSIRHFVQSYNISDTKLSSKTVPTSVLELYNPRFQFMLHLQLAQTGCGRLGGRSLTWNSSHFVKGHISSSVFTVGSVRILGFLIVNPYILVGSYDPYWFMYLTTRGHNPDYHNSILYMLVRSSKR
jgi:hypothetical protein